MHYWKVVTGEGVKSVIEELKVLLESCHEKKVLKV
jgi:hypothetical protein